MFVHSHSVTVVDINACQISTMFQDRISIVFQVNNSNCDIASHSADTATEKQKAVHMSHLIPTQYVW